MKKEEILIIMLDLTFLYECNMLYYNFEKVVIRGTFILGCVLVMLKDAY